MFMSLCGRHNPWSLVVGYSSTMTDPCRSLPPRRWVTGSVRSAWTLVGKAKCVRQYVPGVVISPSPCGTNSTYGNGILPAASLMQVRPCLPRTRCRLQLTNGNVTFVPKYLHPHMPWQCMLLGNMVTRKRRGTSQWGTCARFAVRSFTPGSASPFTWKSSPSAFRSCKPAAASPSGHDCRRVGCS